MPRSDQGDAAKRIREMQAELKEKDEELKRLKALNNVQDIKEIEHEPVRPDELPEHSDPKIKAMTDEELDAEIASVQKELEKC